MGGKNHAWQRRALAAAALLAIAAPAHASSLITLATFDNTNGAYPEGGLIADAAGNLFSTTYGDGVNTFGTVFEMVKTGTSYGSPTIIAAFNSANGARPIGGMVADAAGNLFGTTASGGASGAGTVFEIAKTGNSYGSLTTLTSFNSTNGADPTGGLITDASGNLFGTTLRGGPSDSGTVFEIAKTGNSYGSPTTLATFNRYNGEIPRSGLVADAVGNLFGTTGSGASNYGTVFEIAKTGNTYESLNTLLLFNYTNGAYPAGGLVADAAGNLFGTTESGGSSCCGTVFEIAKTGNTYGSPTTLASFGITSGEDPVGGLIADAAGNLYGTTTYGGS